MSRHIFDDRHDTDSRRYCAVYLAGSRLVVEMHDLIAEIGARFDSDAAGFGRFLREHGLGGDFWNRIGS
jgi:ribosomal protein L17